ncbi:tRNA 2-thiouridine(34) synthase MnmA [Spirulina sp. CS-785/01]|uniref:tRNA 2-thiouridine(34) synthase MnmA n=1 Tax=Spirulina sp. CS-785/01 TaxID=3021716 RepID=UPI00232FDF8A|nr:tRNA 2-thiouridine(34) synthase MnmA [Spirulina sp. CS-785/01]MDB9314513.1 tRNA 2-thiouridine(34) synthase MnmA [Spirulina sp. CS-785/01]
MTPITVGLSGGVDSSVAAATLHHQGYQVIGLTLWLMKGKGQCCSEGMVDAAMICEQLGVPHHVVDSRDLFQTQIVDYLVSGYESGVTPLPCSQCNRTVKFAPMLNYAKGELGCDRVATGHYARIRYDEASGRYQLLRAVDQRKDQSYFLYDLSQTLLAHIHFPLGEITKDETRQIAAQYNLTTATKPESQDLCLVESHGSMRSFLDQYINQKEGKIVDQAGNVLGTHQGIHHYTIGQRKGLGVSAPEPLYVMKLDPVMNQVVVGSRQDATQADCTVQRVNWVSIAEPSTPIRCQVRVRYRTPPVPVNVIPLETGRIKLVFDDPQFGVTPGQAAVLYQDDLLLGGGIIERPA